MLLRLVFFCFFAPFFVSSEELERRQVVIVGSGPAGLSAAIYAARSNLDPLLFEGSVSNVPGGQLLSTTNVENYPGFSDGISGWQLMKQFKQQAQQFGTKILRDDVLSIDFSKRPYLVEGKQTKVFADTIIIASGAKAKRLHVKGTKEAEFWNRGVSACAVCDGPLPMFRDRDLFVIGGGDSAMTEALFLTNFASKVYVVHRRDELRASNIMAERAQSHPKIEILYNKVLLEVAGDMVLRKVVLQDVMTKQKLSLDAGGVFFAIGHLPNTAFLKNQIKLDDHGFIVVQPGSTITNIEGVFAAGDVQDSKYRQAITAAGSGCMAAMDALDYLKTRLENAQ